MSDAIVLYCTSVTSSIEIKKEQQRIEMVLTGKGIAFEKVDISLVEGAKEKMRELAGDKTALPPQLCRGDKYLGNYKQFDEAIENEELNKFLQI
ncbi:SH3 domain-binding glutamic acid-rich-like protein 3 [Dendronephthya gigantea]|uniref:SH3 domain-binding glutamic acid-rich-like protein 3 n=1 Tax=Dendronephthya gigantea TaxID=151771 RepID=UPI00106907BC|nr:SH3 domain-binding glutamic acid-rich-like protein 3 [Dendronephthya gigantea]